MRLLMHLADTDFGNEEHAVVEALVRLSSAQRPDVLLLTGGVTQRASGAEFEAAARFLARMAVRHTLVLPGSHDLPMLDLPLRLVAPYAGFRAVFGKSLEPRFEDLSLSVACLRSTRRWRHTGGSLSRRQVQSSVAYLSQAHAAALRVVATHHPLLAPDPDDGRPAACGAQAALDAWQAAGVRLVMTGHSRRPGMLRAPGTARGDRPLWIAQAGTAASRRLPPGARHSVNLLRRADAGGWRLERWDHSPKLGAFALVDWVIL